MKLIPLLVIVLLLSFLNLTLGAMDINIFSSLSSEESIILWQLRLPKILTALCAGGLLAISGLFMQTYFQNPLVGPYILGIHSGASLGVACWYLIVGSSLGMMGIVGFSGIGALAVLSLLIFISPYLKQKTFLLIFGLILGQLLSGLLSFITLFSPSEVLRSFLLWGMGSFERLSLDYALMMTGATIIFLFLSLLATKPLNMMLLGDRYAQSMGVNLKHVRFFIILISGLMAAIVSATCGPIAFIGVLAPHMARWYCGDLRYHRLILASFFIGAICALGVLVLGLFIQPYTLPANVLLSILSAPILFYILIRLRGKSYVF